MSICAVSAFRWKRKVDIQLLLYGQDRRLCRPRKVMNGDSHEISLMCQSLLCPLSPFSSKSWFWYKMTRNILLSTVPAGNHDRRIGGVNVVTMVTGNRESRTSIDVGGNRFKGGDDTPVTTWNHATKCGTGYHVVTTAM